MKRRVVIVSALTALAVSTFGFISAASAARVCGPDSSIDILRDWEACGTLCPGDAGRQL